MCVVEELSALNACASLSAGFSAVKMITARTSSCRVCSCSQPSANTKHTPDVHVQVAGAPRTSQLHGHK